ncbi:peroxisomal membrane anchor protein conserved region-domain-containing protein [Panaeolus papilionaceus]|nr:peroxisomal membrane anchor protein conserved region-domain-containing protein [Panaeolus papilionaceus]
MSTPDRQELVRNAVAFLSDPKTQASPVTQRIQFLEAKGLTPAEIDIALKQASAISVTPPPPQYASSYSNNPYAMPPSPQRWDWRDYFITAVVSGAATYGAVSLFKKFLYPHLQPPTSTAYEEDRDALNAQYDAAEALLKEIQAETVAVRAAVEEQKEKIDKTTEDVKVVVTDLRQGEARTRDEMREVRDEVNNIREMLPKMIEKNKESQNQSLAELQQELKSLKALLLSRPATSTPSTPFPLAGRPTIPSWQLASTPQSTDSSSYTIPVPTATKPASDAASSPLVDSLEPTAEVEATKTGGNSNVSSSDEDTDNAPSHTEEETATATVENTVDVTMQTTPQDSESNDSEVAAEAPNPDPTQTLLHVDVVEALVGNLAMNTSLDASPVPKSPNLIGVDPEEPVSPSSYLPPTEFEPEVIKEAINRVLLEKSVLTEPISTLPTKDQSSEVEALQARLKQIEQHVSTSFKRLQAEKQAADAVLREVSPLESIKDADALRDFFTELKTKDQVFQDEIKRLNQKLEAQEDRMEAIQMTHEQQIRTLTDEKQKIRTQLDETEKLFAATQAASAQAEDAANAQKEDVSRLQREVGVQKALAKEEEEKRVKAISLLKTVRQKLVKAEKDREDAQKEMVAVKEREKGDRSKEEALKQSLQQEMEKLSVNHERTVATLRSQFDKDFASMRERYEQDIAALRGQSELDIATLKSTHSGELNAKANLITTLESAINKITQDKNEFFDSLQMRQAELESAHSHLESLQHQNTELQFQLRESNERLALLKEEAAELMREQDSRIRDPVISADEITRMVTATEAKYEARLAEAQRRLATMEKERYESEADWSRKLREKVKDLEELRRILGTANKSRENDESVVASLKEQLSQEKNTLKALQNQVAQLPLLKEHIIELEKAVKEQEKEINIKNQLLERQVEESKAREAQLKQSNKSLKDELRKVQSSAALLERQRNPGVGGYWGNRGESSTGNGSAISLPSVGEAPSRVSSPAPTSSSGKQEEEVNLEYLRNVILQFLEHKEMRPNLVRVLSIILHFTPQETRRLIAKV